MVEIGGLPPAVLIAGGVYVIGNKAQISFTDPYFIFGTVLIMIGCYMHMNYLKIWPLNQ